MSARRRALARFVRRFLLLAGLMFWQGGFTFYAAVVVPVSQEIFREHFGSPLGQGFITREVTVFLNVSGLVALLCFTWDLLSARDPSGGRRRGRWLAWAGMLLLLFIMIWLHQRLDERLDAEEWQILARREFTVRHRWYLWLSTFQWAGALVFTAITLSAWRAEDLASQER